MSAKTAAKLVLHIDFREKSLYETLKGAPNMTVASQNLEVGDVMFSLEGGEPLLVLERKSLSDLASSNRDGRYREQRARLLSVKGQGVAIGYIIEIGNGWSNELNRIWPGKVVESTLYSIVLRLQMRYGISVLQTKDAAGSVALIGQLYKMLQEDSEVFSQGGGIVGDATVAAAAYTEALSAQKSANRSLKRVAAGMLCACPGVGAKMSESILDACEGTLEGVMKKSEAELALVSLGKRTVGKVLAKTLYAALHCV
jgi:ERCC4-type nuclease